MAELEFNLLYRWFVGLGIDDAAWDATVFCKNRDRLLAGDVANRFLAVLLAQPRVKRLLSSEHFSVDGTLIEAWASIKSFRPIDGGGGCGGGEPPGEDAPPAEPAPEGRNAERDFHGARWSNETHRSTTDEDARLYRKGRGKEARLSYLGHALMEWFGRLTMRPERAGGRRSGQPGDRRGRAAGGGGDAAAADGP